MDNNKHITFKTPTLNKAERVVWHPEVHTKLFGETCHFFLIRIRKPEKNVGQSIRAFFGRAQIKTTCVYAIYGYFDFLVRLWATPTKLKWLSDLVEEDSALIEEIREFRVNHISYEGAKSLHIGFPIFNFEQEIIQVSQMDDQGRAIDKGDTVIQHLLNQDLIWQFKPLRGATFKFYIALARVSPITPKGQLSKNINNFLSKFKSDLRLNNVAVYEGIGFGDFLVKAVVENYADAWRCIERMLESTDLDELRPTTYLIAATIEESDAIDYTWNELDRTLLQLGSLLGEPYVKLMQQLSPDEQIGFTRLFKQFIYLTDTVFKPIFLGVFQARLKQSTLLLMEKLLFIFQLENLLREFLYETCRETFVNAYWENIREAMRSTRISQEIQDPKNNQVKWSDKKLEEFTFHDSITILGKLFAVHPEMKAKAEQIVSSDDLAAFRALGEIRNSLAHGRILPNRDLVATQWAELAQQVFSVGGAYNRLVEWQIQRDH